MREVSQHREEKKIYWRGSHVRANEAKITTKTSASVADIWPACAKEAAVKAKTNSGVYALLVRALHAVKRIGEWGGGGERGIYQ